MVQHDSADSLKPSGESGSGPHLDAVISASAGPTAKARPEQYEAVAALVEHRRRVLVVMPTGWGKSAVYLGATAARRAQGAGPTIVVSPLLALMRDQVAAAARAGLRAATINSANIEDWNAVFAELEADRLDLLLVSPERLANPKFEAVAMPLLARAGLLVIDEAHCISDWGFDFRPDYQRIASLLMKLADDAPVLAATATANERVTADVAEQLGAGTLTLRGPLARKTLTLSVIPGLTGAARAAWVAEALPALPGSGIVYCLTVKQVETLTAFLRDAGHEVRPYTGGMTAEDRVAAEDALKANAVKALVATSALGMGYDKPDLGFCIHVGAPDSPVSYYQQVGRAGRAIDSAVGVLLPAPDLEAGLWDYFASAGVPSQENADKLLAALDRNQPKSVIALESATGIRRGRLEMLLKTLRVAQAVELVGSGWIATGRGWTFDHARYASIAQSRRAEQELMRQYSTSRRCLMRILTEALGDADAGDCGRCSACTGLLPTPGLTPDPALVRKALESARSEVVPVPPRRQWPSGLSQVKGRIAGAEEGRAIFFGDNEAFGELARELKGPDAEASDALASAAVAVLSSWSKTWSSRPQMVQAGPSENPLRTRSLARHIAEVGRLELCEALTGPAVPEDPDGSAHARVGKLIESLRAEPMRAAPVLLVTDRARSTWTLTVASVHLRRAGATAVLPLVGQLLP